MIVEHGESGQTLGDCGEIARNGVAGETVLVVGQGTGIPGGSSDAKGGTPDQGDETVEHNKREAKTGRWQRQNGCGTGHFG